MDDVNWIKLKDFIHTAFAIDVKNTTTKTTVKRRDEIQLVEMTDDGISLKLPAKSCALGHLLFIRLERKRSGLGISNDELRQVTVTAKVIGVEKFDNDAEIVAVKFYQVQEKQWNDFLKDFMERQGEIDDIVKKIKD